MYFTVWTHYMIGFTITESSSFLASQIGDNPIGTEDT